MINLFKMFKTKDNKHKRQKIISVFYKEYFKEILTEFDFNAIVEGAMVETIDGRKVKINKIDKEKRRIYGFIYDEHWHKWGSELWWDENGYILGWDSIETYTGRDSLAILNYTPLVKNEVKKDKYKKITKPFNLDAVLDGALVETKSGYEVEIGQIINHPSYNENCIFAYVFYSGKKRPGNCYWWCPDGRRDEGKDSKNDLVIVEYVEDNFKINNNKIINMEIKDLEVIQRLREWYRKENKHLTEGSNEALLEKFPELKEDGDDRFMNYIIDLCEEVLTNDRGLMLSVDTTKKLYDWIKRQQERKDNGKL